MHSLTKVRALVDGDILVYRVAWACQKTEYSVYLKGEEEAGRIASFLGKTDLNAWIKEHDQDDLTVTERVLVDEVPKALHSVKMMLHNIVEKLHAEEIQVHLSGSNNFRNHIYPSYKAGRGAKPELYHAIRDYLINYWSAQVWEDYEADDALGIAQCTNTPDRFRTVICSNDKDLDMIPGMHYDFVKDEEYFVSEEEANFNFDVQMLTGDGTDNICGLKGIGPVKAGKYLMGYESPEERMKAITDKYKEYWGEGWEDVYNLNSQLLWILREPSDETQDNRSEGVQEAAST